MTEDSLPLTGIHVLTLCVNVPGPAAARRLREMGASVTKVEPPGGDPLSNSNPPWYKALSTDQKIIRLNLKEPGDRSRLESYLEHTDLLLTSSRPAALERLGLGWEKLHSSYPHLSQVAIIGYPPPEEEVPGHDLTYLADLGLLSPPELPRTLLADLAGAERAVSCALALLLGRERGQDAGYAQVSLARVAETFAEPLGFGITRPGAPLGGGLPGYNLYRASDGWIAVAALEEHFWQSLLHELRLRNAAKEDLQKIFLRKTAKDWERWAAERGLPVAAVYDPHENSKKEEMQ